MKKIYQLTLALLLLSPLVFAQSAKTFTWDPPTQYEDGTTLINADIAEYRIYCGGQLLATVPNEPEGTGSYVAELAAGDYSCTATAVTVLGVESAESNAVTFTVAPGVPNPPAQFAFQ